jgi:hypothetical protein
LEKLLVFGIVTKGKWKKQITDVLRNKFSDSLIIFVSDRTEKGKNEYSIVQRLLKLGNSKIVSVDNPNDIMKKELSVAVEKDIKTYLKIYIR